LIDSVQLRVRPSSLSGWFMTHGLDVAGGRDTIARWCALAEQRLEWLAELFETGRWRRFHSEHVFLENFEEAKAAVRVWRQLSAREASRDDRSIDMSWADRTGAAARGMTWREAALPWPARIAAENLPKKAENPRRYSSVGGEIGNPPAHAARSDAVTEMSSIRPMQNLAATIAQRYPLLRNRL
jgi:uncharacterized repeat protein (TIGR03809 family)